jgi:hypothetical protein
MKTDEIQQVLVRMSELLLLGNFNDRACMFARMANDVGKEYAAMRPEIRRMYGGMGSLNDIVLCREGCMLKKENEEFDVLRERLYELTATVNE